MQSKTVTGVLPEKQLKERILHALLFEGIAIMLITPLAALWMGASLAHVGALTVILSTTAMLWNMTYNHFFEKIERRRQWTRTPKLRAIHALLFEIGFLAAALPITAFWLDIGVLDALILDIGFFLFFLPYAYVFNWAYDYLRGRYFQNRPNRCVQ